MTTINHPTMATLKFASMSDWKLIVVGDLKTPHEEYAKLNCTYLHPEDQSHMYPELSKMLGWRSIQRRNIGFLYAYQQGADIIATVDDDNIPFNNWGTNVLVGQTVECDLYTTDLEVFDPLSITSRKDVWHRGYPIELVPVRHKVKAAGKTFRKVLIQAELWNGDPDIDAIARLTISPLVDYSEITGPYCANKISPFNSQNTFIAREAIPYYAVLPFVGRMDDIWGSYIFQHFFPDSVIYGPASVYQDRNLQDLVTNLENEIIGYRKTYKLLQDLNNFEEHLPTETRNFFKKYREFYSA